MPRRTREQMLSAAQAKASAIFEALLAEASKGQSLWLNENRLSDALYEVDRRAQIVRAKSITPTWKDLKRAAANVKDDYIRAVSVGFIPKKWKNREGKGR